MEQSAYEQSQLVTFQSFESETDSYANGQRRALEIFFADIPKDVTILDCACGDGVGLKWFKDNGYRFVEGVELNPRKVEKAKQHCPWVWCLDMHNLNQFSAGPGFDFIWSSHSLEHAHDPIQVLKEFEKALDPKGQLFLIVPFPDKINAEAHCGASALKTDRDNYEEFLAVIESVFNVIDSKVDSGREPEIWVKASVKREKNYDRHG